MLRNIEVWCLKIIVRLRLVLIDSHTSRYQIFIDRNKYFCYYFIKLFLTLFCHFRYIFTELDVSIKVLSTSEQTEPPDSKSKAEAITMFYLQVLSGCELNNTTFEMLLTKKSSCPVLSRNSPATQHALAWLLYSHSTR